MREREGQVSTLMADTTPSLDLVFDLLSNSRRRYALYYLNEQPDGVATLETLTENVVSLEQLTGAADGDTDANARVQTDCDYGGDTTAQHPRIRLELTHTHLPKLEDAGVLEYDQRSEMVRYWGQPSIEEWLEHARHKEIT
ncbi:hypothetical protein ACFR99_02535 [Haloarchaeobius amylolyticus]|uniref:DUF7344 domain-containing protein n=1 Tax=Haloarchaeobius amylolyticus TaxID=1198296 RepID=A0ABD6BBM3_9EURY